MRLQSFLNVVVLFCLVFSSVGPSVPAQAGEGGDVTQAGDESPAPAGAEAGSAALDLNQILITEAGFSPDVITIAVGSQVKVDASAVDILPGARLTAADLAGHARGLRTETLNGMPVTEGAPVVGIALAAPTAESDTIPVFVSLR